MARVRDDRILVAAAWLTVLIATTAMVASAMRSDAVARAAILQVLADAPAQQAAIQVSVAERPDRLDDTDRVVRDEVRRALGAASGTTWAWGTTDGYRMAGAGDRERLVFGFADGLAEHARLVEGAWPPAAREADGTIVAAISVAASERLGLALDERLTVTGSGVDGLAVPVRIGARYEPIDPADPYWWGDPLALEGAMTDRGFTMLGPLMVDRSFVLGELTDLWTAMRWRTLPDRGAIDPTSVASIAGGVTDLERRISTDLGRKGAANVASELPAILRRATSGTRASGSGILLLDGQIIVLGGYALIMVAAMVVERRRGTTGVLRVRGVSTAQLLRLTATEACLLVLPAIVLAPALAAVLLVALGAMAPAGAVAVAPRLTSEAIVLAAIAALVAVIGMAIPVLASSGPLASMRHSVGRQLSRTAAHRTGLDLAFLAFAAVLLWELRANGAPISASFRGSVGIDPLLVAAPAIGLAAGAVLTMRVVPALADSLERLAGRRQGVVGTMAARSIARRSSRYSRSALLLVVAVAIAFLTTTYERTWLRSQLDQVASTTPADLTARPATPVAGAGAAAVPDGATAPASMAQARAAYRTVDGVAEAAPIVEQPFDLKLPNGRGRFVALSPELATVAVDPRAVAAERPLADQLAAMIAARPRLSTIELPADARWLRATVETSVAAVPAGPGTIERRTGPLELAVIAVVRDAAGLLHRARSTTTVDPGRPQAELSLELTGPAGEGLPAASPLEVLAVELETTIPAGTAAEGVARVTGLEVAKGAAAERVWEPLDWAGVSPAWTWAKVLVPRLDPDGTVVTDAAPATASLAGENQLAGLDTLRLTVGPSELAGLEMVPLPSLVDERMRALIAPDRDGSVAVTQGFADIRRLQAVGTVDRVPTLDPGRPAAIVDLPTLQLVEWLRGGVILPADSWWLALAPGADPHAATGRLAGSAWPLEATTIKVEAIEARTLDPFQAGVTSVLGLVAGSALLFALVGLAISLWYTVSSRQGEFAVARALGLQRRQLLGWLALESAFLIVVGVIGGLLVGIVLAWVVMPSITLTAEGRAPVPPPVTVVAWDLVLALIGLGLLAFALSVLAARRAVASVRVAATLRLGEADR